MSRRLTENGGRRWDISSAVEKVSLTKKHIALTFPVSSYLFPIVECINLWLDLYLTRTQDLSFYFCDRGLKNCVHYCVIKFHVTVAL